MSNTIEFPWPYVPAPKSGKTTYHRDGTVTVFNVYSQLWERLGSVPDRVLASLDDDERQRIIRHTKEEK